MGALRRGPFPAEKIEEMAKELDISPRTVLRARAELGVIARDGMLALPGYEREQIMVTPEVVQSVLAAVNANCQMPKLDLIS